MNNLNSQKGFTLIELVMVIVIVAILAAVAIPKFINLAGSAKNSALAGVVAALQAAAANNFAACQIAPTDPTRCSTVSICSDLSSLLAAGALPSGYTWENPTNSVDSGCNLNDSNNDSQPVMANAVQGPNSSSNASGVNSVNSVYTGSGSGAGTPISNTSNSTATGINTPVSNNPNTVPPVSSPQSSGSNSGPTCPGNVPAVYDASGHFLYCPQ